MPSVIAGGSAMAEQQTPECDSETCLLDVRGLRVAFPTSGGSAASGGARRRPVRRAGETVGLVGESGSGKTMTHALGDPPPPEDRPRRRRPDALRGQGRPSARTEGCGSCAPRSIGTVFQDPYSSLNPVARIGDQLMEVLKLNWASRREAEQTAVEACGMSASQAPRSGSARILTSSAAACDSA